MMLLLDTNSCIYIIKRKPDEVLRHFQQYHPGDIGISSITLAELQYGVAKSQAPQRNSEALSEFLIPIEVLPFGEAATQSYGIIRASLEQQGKIIGAMDLLIAAHALSLGAVLVTNNVKEFARVPGLKIENWVNAKT
ncbi:MAG: type II toxin-antitoxin system VapC family toxin [Desulfuromonadaceae bacterium]|nr:type II toxin-antitoxin system VapC family toxin [Desulfuromonadaceae bacterium]